MAEGTQDGVSRTRPHGQISETRAIVMLRTRQVRVGKDNQRAFPTDRWRTCVGMAGHSTLRCSRCRRVSASVTGHPDNVGMSLMAPGCVKTPTFSHSLGPERT
jgi:hypothetical protein